jgi:hypothetical protein
VLPRIVRHGQVYFRHVRCPFQKEDCIAEMVAFSWVWYLRLVERGKDPAAFVSALAGYAARAVRRGRRVCGQEKAKDALSPVAQQRHHFVVEPLPDCSTPSSNLLADAIRENARSPVPDQVCFRQDFPAWRSSRSERDRRLIDDLMVGERALAVADRYGLSPGRISQLRREFHDDWERFCAPPGEA